MEEPWRLLYVGQLVPLKGLNYLFDALAMVQRRHEVSLDLVYHVDTDLAALRSRRPRHSSLHGVRFLGRRSPSELAELYASCDVFVLPSTWRRYRA